MAKHIAFVCPRYAEASTVGGAETLLRALAERIALLGHRVTFLTTCARNHLTWANEVEAGTRTSQGVEIRFFPVRPGRDVAAFLKLQRAICAGRSLSDAEELAWLANSVNSDPLLDHLRREGDRFDALVMGPYLFGLTYFAAELFPRKTFLVPCLHDEPFARVRAFQRLFGAVRGFLFNSEPEMDLARRLFPLARAQASVVGLGFEPFEADPAAFAAARGLRAPYVIYSGRQETLKGTPLLVDYLRAFRSRTGKDVKLVLTGTGDVDVTPDMAPHVVRAGVLPEQDKRNAMAGAVAFCHPSVNESLGIVVLESWLAHTPVLVHAKCEVLRRHCERSNGGLWFRAYPDFEEELLLILADADLRRRLAGAGCRYVAEHYHWDVVTRRLAAALGLPPAREADA